MSRENDTSQGPWDEQAEEDSYEGETRLRQRPRSSRYTYDDPSARSRQHPRQTGKESQGSYEGRPGRRRTPYRSNDPRQSYDAYGRPRQSTRSPRDSNKYTTEPFRERPRRTRDFREHPDPYDEVDERYHRQHQMSRHPQQEAEARLHRRLRKPDNSREEVYDTFAHPQQRNRPLVEPEVEKFDRRALRPRTRTQTTQLPVRRRRRVWSTLFIGCIGGMITLALIVGVLAFVLFRSIPFNIIGIGKTSFTKPLPQQTLPITSSITQLQVDNRVGNITISVDPNSTQAFLTGMMKVQAGNSNDAGKEFGRISVDVKAGSDPSILLVNATVPVTGGSVLASASDSVDLAIVLPPSVNEIPPFTLNADVAATGDISVQNFNGIFSLTGNAGNITVKHGLLAAGSCVQTNNGSITIGGGSVLDLIYASPRIPCTTTTSQNPHPWFSFKSGTGNVDVTLGSESTNVILHASTINGKINNDFGLNVQQNSDGSTTYHGPLIAGSSPTASLVVAVSTGNINVHKAA